MCYNCTDKEDYVHERSQIALSTIYKILVYMNCIKRERFLCIALC